MFIKSENSMEETKVHTPGFWKRLALQMSRLWRKEIKETNVYFISGMCYNCKVFDKLKLPTGFKKCYIEWHMPHEGESLSEYTRTMAKDIDVTQPFILVGYSFGAVIIQEMTLFLNPIKIIIISSFKSEKEIPLLFQAVRLTNLIELVPKRIFSSTDFITNAFNHLVYHASTETLAEYMTYTDPVYIKWAIEQITHWVPDNKSKHLYHIHGTQDQIFPYDRLKNVFPVEGGDHLMVVKKADVVNSLLDSILLRKDP